MTTERAPKPRIARNGRRPHPARNARLISTGAAASLTLGVVAALAIGDASAASRASASMVVEQTTNDAAPVSTSVTPATITVIRRIHYLPATVAVAPVPQAATDAVVFSPQPAVRADVAAVSPPKASSVRRTVVKRQTPTRRARRATRAS